MAKHFLLLVLLFWVSVPATAQSRIATITGRLTEGGKPAAGILVAAFDVDDQLAPAPRIVSSTETDASGRYRLRELPPGRYYIGAGLLETLEYFPGKPSVREIVTVREGIASENVDFAISAVARGLTVRGRVKGKPGKFLGTTTLMLTGSSVKTTDPLNRTQTVTILKPTEQTTTVNPDGSFEFRKVRRGRYGFRMTPVTFLGSATVEVVDENIEDFELFVPPTIPVKGKVDVEGGGPMPELVFELLSDPNGLAADSNVRAGIPQTDGEFTIALPISEFRLKLSTLSRIPSGVRLKSMMLGATDLMRSPAKIAENNSLELRLGFAAATKNWSKVTGTVAGTGVVPHDLKVSLFPVTSTGLIPVQTASIGSDGSFELPGILPGTYTAQLTPAPPGVSEAGIRLVVGQSDVTGVRIAIPNYVNVPVVVRVKGNGPVPTFSVKTPEGSTYSTLFKDEKMSINLPEGSLRVNVVPTSLPPGYSVKELSYGSMDLPANTLNVTAGEHNELHVSLGVAPNSLFKVAGRITQSAPALRSGLPVISGPDGASTNGDLSAYLKQLAEGLPESRRATLLRHSHQPFSLAPQTTTIAPDGTFEFPGVPPGPYTLIVQVSGNGVAAEVLSVNVKDEDITGLKVVFH